MQKGLELFTTNGLNSIKYHIKEIKQRAAFTSIVVEFVPEEVRIFDLCGAFLYFIFNSTEILNNNSQKKNTIFQPVFLNSSLTKSRTMLKRKISKNVQINELIFSIFSIKKESEIESKLLRL